MDAPSHPESVPDGSAPPPRRDHKSASVLVVATSPFARVTRFEKLRPCRRDTTWCTHHRLGAKLPNQSSPLCVLVLDRQHHVTPTTFPAQVNQTSLNQLPHSPLYPIAKHCDLSFVPIPLDTLQSLDDHKSPFLRSGCPNVAVHLQFQRQVPERGAEYCDLDDHLDPCRRHLSE